MSQLPDNIISRLSRVYVSNNSFKDDSGKTVEYQRFVVEYFVKGEPLTIEVPVRKDSPVTPKDILLLGLADKPEPASTF